MALDLKPLFIEADIRAERTVAIIRILFGIALAVALLVVMPQQLPADGRGPNSESADAAGTLSFQTHLAEVTIGGYIGLGVLALVLIRFRAYKSWMAWPFATLDAFFALSAVWVSLENAGLMGAYAPLLPATWLLLIVLAFGALRYNPKLQAYLTALTAGGLACVIWITDGIVPIEWMETATDKGALLFTAPATIMRLIMLAVVGAVLTLGVWRATQTLRRATAESARRDNLVRYLPRAIADLLAEGTIDELRHGRRDPLAVLFVDVRGFTSLAEGMDTSALASFMTEFRLRISRAAEAEGGVVDKFVGDGAMIVFGLDAPNADDTTRAVACMHRIVAELENWNRERAAAGAKPVRLAIGAHWGEAFCGAVGDESRLEFTVLGDVVNVASRLETRAKSEDATAVVSGTMLERAGGGEAHGWQSLGTSNVRGRSASLELFMLRKDIAGRTW